MAISLLKHRSLVWQLALRRIGWPRLAIGLLLVVCVVIHAGLLPSWRLRTAEIQRSQAQFGEHSVEGRQGQLLNERLQQFRQRLAGADERSASLKVLFTEAASQGLALNQADYQLLVDEEGGYQKLHISLPIKGSYPKVRGFVEAVLAKLPAASLDEMSFHRGSVKNPNIEARLKFTLFLREAK